MATRTRIAIAVGVIIGTTTVLWGQEPRSPGAAVDRSVYRAGDVVDITGDVRRDAVVAGRTVRIAAPVRGDVLAAGWSVTLESDAQDDVRIAAGHLSVQGKVAGDLTVTGGDVSVGPRAHVGGQTFVAGNTVRVEGVLDGEARIAAALVQIAGEIRQPATIIGDRIEFLPSARILAPVTYRSPQQAWIASGATVTAPVTFQRIESREVQQSRGASGVTSVVFVLQVGFAGLLLVLLLPRVSATVVGTLRVQPWHSLLIGLAVLLVTPVATLFLLVSVFGIPTAIAVGATYVVAVLAGLVATAILIGEVEMHRVRVGLTNPISQRLASLAAGLVTLGVLRLVPVVGSLAVFASIACGLGALVLAGYRLSRQAPSTA